MEKLRVARLLFEAHEKLVRYETLMREVRYSAIRQDRTGGVYVHRCILCGASCQNLESSGYRQIPHSSGCVIMHMAHEWEGLQEWLSNQAGPLQELATELNALPKAPTRDDNPGSYDIEI